ncbi:GNAT family N-acetyltransferase [[Eubacterium] cellulosolvens]
MWKVEEATEADADKLVELYARVWEKFEGILPHQLLNNRRPDKNEIIQSMVSKKYFIIRDEGRIIGVARTSLQHGTCFLDRMVVDEEHRKQGIGSALINSIISFAQENKASKVWLNTNTKLNDAMSLYSKMGFKECGHFTKHFWGDDVKYYELLLEYKWL